jgi:hypothetical protein
MWLEGEGSPARGLIAYRYLVGTGDCATSSGSARSSSRALQEARRLLAERREIVEELERAKRDYLGSRERIERLK